MFKHPFSIVSSQILNCESASRCFQKGEGPFQGHFRSSHYNLFRFDCKCEACREDLPNLEAISDTCTK